jgi:hypothetical protein
MKTSYSCFIPGGRVVSPSREFVKTRIRGVSRDLRKHQCTWAKLCSVAVLQSKNKVEVKVEVETI